MQSNSAFRDTHLPPNSAIRVAGRDRPLSAVVADAQALPVELKCIAPSPGEDFALIDPALMVTSEPATPMEGAPAPGLGYAAFTPRQRGWFLAWQATPLAPAPPALQQLYLASLEVRLLEGDPFARRQIEQFLQSDAWTSNPAVWRVALLAGWLAQDGPALANLIAAHALPAELAGPALGMQALLGAPLTAAEASSVAYSWRLPAADLSGAVLAFRLQSQAAALGQEPLARALAQLGDEARAPQPWRCQHRSLRIAMPQPDVRRTLEPLLAELALMGEPTPLKSTDSPAVEVASGSHNELNRAHLILEFRHSRSEFFAAVLHQAQRRAGFMQILDEDRHVVYRVAFRKNEMNAFWQLWNYVQNWTGTRIYSQGQELQKSHVYPYSQYLR